MDKNGEIKQRVETAIVKRDPLRFDTKSVFVLLTILFFTFVCSVIYFSAVSEKHNQAAETGVYAAADNQREASRMRWAMDNNKIVSGKIAGKTIKNNAKYSDIFLTISHVNNRFIFEIYDHNQIVLMDNAACQIDYGEIIYEKGMDTSNHVLEIEEDIFAPFLLADGAVGRGIVTVSFFEMMDNETEKYVFQLGSDNFPAMWSLINGKTYEHLPVWETE